LQDEIADRLGGFQVLRHKHELYGLCAKARGVKGGYCPKEAEQAQVVHHATSHRPSTRS
jgi:Fur family ferric uptake transcriptional regulator